MFISVKTVLFFPQFHALPLFLVHHVHVLHFHVRYFHVLQFHVLQIGLSFSRSATSRPAHWSVNFMSCNFMPCNFDGPSFSRTAFSVNPFVSWSGWREVTKRTAFGCRFCCLQRPTTTLKSESNEMMIIFKSNYSIDSDYLRRGFQAVVKAGMLCGSNSVALFLCLVLVTDCICFTFVEKSTIANNTVHQLS